MKKPFPAFCKDCKYSKPEEKSEWNLRCHHPVVNADDSYALASPKMNGTQCSDERRGNWRNKCGMRGALWVPK